MGLVPLGLAFGVLLVQSGCAWYWAPLFSLLIYAGSMEFLAIGLLLVGTPWSSLKVTSFFVHFRHLFYGLSFPLKRTPPIATKPRSSVSGRRALAVAATGCAGAARRCYRCVAVPQLTLLRHQWRAKTVVVRCRNRGVRESR